MKHLLDSIGKQGVADLGVLVIDVLILDAKVAYGNDRYLIEPIEQKYKAKARWINANRVTNIK